MSQKLVPIVGVTDDTTGLITAIKPDQSAGVNTPIGTTSSSSIVTALQNPSSPSDLPTIQGLVSGAALGLVATRCACMGAFIGSNKQTMSRSAHIATEAISSLQIVLGNWSVQVNSGERTIEVLRITRVTFNDFHIISPALAFNFLRIAHQDTHSLAIAMQIAH